MPRIGFALLFLWLCACGNDKKSTEEDDHNYSYNSLTKRFKEVTPPYQLSDTGLLNNKDTSTIRYAQFVAKLDSITTPVFGKQQVKYSPLASIKGSKKETYLIIKATGKSKKAAYLVVYNDENFSTALPFLMPDSDAKTTQLSSIDRSFAITKAVSKKDEEGTLVDGKEVYAFNAESNSFTLVLTDMFDNASMELINPIDTLPQTHKYAGDYYLDKKSLVSIRNGRNENTLNVFIHITKSDGACTGELKGEVLLKNNVAAFRQSGNPCVLELKFSGKSVTLKEEGGCGSSRGMDCSFDGSYVKKKVTKTPVSPKQK
jgi:hypothetical protein